MSERLETTAKLYEEAAQELDLAARQCEVAAQHFGTSSCHAGPRMHGRRGRHLLEAEKRLDEQAIEHSRRSRIETTPGGQAAT